MLEDDTSAEAVQGRTIGLERKSFMATKSLNSGRYHLINLIFFISVYFRILAHITNIARTKSTT